MLLLQPMEVTPQQVITTTAQLDISRINGSKMALTGVTNQITQLQLAMDDFPNVRENFGPYFKHKYSSESNSWNYNHPVGGHNDHIHFSVR
jgi:hypothetical protein